MERSCPTPSAGIYPFQRPSNTRSAFPHQYRWDLCVHYVSTKSLAHCQIQCCLLHHLRHY